MEHMPCHMQHTPPYEEASCIYGFCMRCRNEHCAFDCCVPNAQVIGVFPIARIVMPYSHPGMN